MTCGYCLALLLLCLFGTELSNLDLSLSVPCAEHLKQVQISFAWMQ